MLGLHVVLEGGEAAAVLGDAALGALVLAQLARAQLGDPLPDHVADSFPLV